jgi:O-antigen/teichoic acid export membrane protein
LKIKKFFGQAVVYGLGGTIAKFTNVLTTPIYTRFLDSKGFGELDLATTITALLVLLSSLELHSGFARSYYEKQKQKELGILTGSIVWFYILTGFLIFILTLLILNLFPQIFNNFNQSLILPIVANVLPINLLSVFLVSLRFENKAKHYSYIVISNTLMTGIFGIIAVLLFESKVEGILWANTIVSYLVCLIAFIILKKNINNLRFNKKMFIEMLKYGAPLTPARAGSWVKESGARIFIVGALSLSSLGIYALALKVSLIFKLIGNAFNLTWSPTQIKLFDSKNSENKIAETINFYLPVMFFIAIIITSISPFIVTVLATPEFYSAISLTGILTVAYLWDSTITIFSSGNNWSRKTYYNSLGSLAGGLSVVLILWFWIEIYGLLIAAISLLVGSIIKSLLILYTSQKNHRIPFSISNIIWSLLLTISFSLISYYFFEIQLFSFLKQSIIILVIGLLLLIILIIKVFKIYNYKRIRELIILFRENI